MMLTLAVSFQFAPAAVVDFEDLAVRPPVITHGSDGAGGFDSRGVHFNNSYDNSFASWAGFSYSNRTDSTTPGFGNQYSAVTGTGAGGTARYAVGYDDFFQPRADDHAAGRTSPVSVMITNTTYAYDAIASGDDGFGPGTDLSGSSGAIRPPRPLEIRGIRFLQIDDHGVKPR